MNQFIDIQSADYFEPTSSILGMSTDIKHIKGETFRLSKNEKKGLSDAQLNKLIRLVNKRKSDLQKKYGFNSVSIGCTTFPRCHHKPHWEWYWDDFVKKGGYRTLYNIAKGKSSFKINSSFKLKEGNSEQPQNPQINYGNPQIIYSLGGNPNSISEQSDPANKRPRFEAPQHGSPDEYGNPQIIYSLGGNPNSISEQSDPANKKPQLEAPQHGSPDESVERLQDEITVSDEKPKLPLKNILIVTALVGLGIFAYYKFIKK